MQENRYCFFLSFLFLLLFANPKEGKAYGVLTHQAIIDVAWEPSLLPILKKKYPGATEEQLRTAHAHAYGGAIIQDMGYYPFGNTFFTDLTHYVRSGDFIVALLEEAHTLDEYAFALGALAHYYADNYGHPIGTNRSVPLVYPEMKAQYGNSVTYEENPVAHIKMEFGFDVLQVARGNYAPEAYHDFIGFEVSQESLERAFKKTYGLEFSSLFVSLKLTIGSFRRSVNTLIPSLTKAAWNLKESDIKSGKPSMTRRQYLYRIRKTDYHKQWGREYQQPNLFQKFLSWLLRVLPKIGPNRTFAFKPPTPEAEQFFMESFNATSKNYGLGLQNLPVTASSLQNTALDTGDRSALGKYGKADKTYAEWLKKLDKEGFASLKPELKQNLLTFYSKSGNRRTTDKKEIEEWEQTQELLAKLKGQQVN
ncbi:zinc dependent phospholipase C family protein [Rufibacter hautae]|uniref:Zinc dependent phospholipase C family protein n=1 Tax=Rufibacter hautae TaxID=2595005 RepID=A0A5B6TFG0_9BACT|nr:zinc dependent phospholipase C family protein [Rufibacter hautae]KAA3438015.1 zinc dependent phospholipase C family protein [Rufibacter hautae]